MPLRNRPRYDVASGVARIFSHAPQTFMSCWACGSSDRNVNPSMRIVRGWQAAGRIDGFAFLALDGHAQQLMNVSGACEKIRSTPLAMSYRSLLRKGIAGYMVLLPWLLNDDLGWLTVPVAILVAYAVVGLELIATSIEDPFGYDGDDLPLEEFVATIRRSAKGEM